MTLWCRKAREVAHAARKKIDWLRRGLVAVIPIGILAMRRP